MSVVELEMQILRYRQTTSRRTDDAYLKRVNQQVADLEQKLREIDK